MKLGILEGAKTDEIRADFYLKDDDDGDVSVGVLINGIKLKLGYFTVEDDRITLFRYCFSNSEIGELINQDNNLIKVI